MDPEETVRAARSAASAGPNLSGIERSMKKHAMKCEKCQVRDAAVPLTRVVKGDRKVFQLCWPCASSFDCDQQVGVIGVNTFQTPISFC